MLAAAGPPQPGVVADGPYGVALGRRDEPTLLAVNPSPDPVTVTFRRDGHTVAKVRLDPGETVTRTP